MSDGFTKLFHSITTSTVWMQPDNVRIVWITMLALADKDGVVFASVPGLAHVARVELAATEAALKVLSDPDPYSRTPDSDGRRIEAVDGGWRIINHAKYRNTRDFEDRKEYERARKKAQRDKSKSPGQSGTCPEIPGLSAHTEAEAEADTEAEEEQRLPAKGGVKPCPHEAIVSLYHEVLPALPHIRVMTAKRKSYLAARWRDDVKRQELKWWRAFFEYIAKSDFLCGRVPGSGDRRDQPPFMADLEWLLKESNFVKIIEGKYHRRAA